MVRQQRYQQRGVTLIEVMVTVLVLSIGLLGMAALQARLQKSEVEAYQRSQALLLLGDMANRLVANRSNAAKYEAINPVGAGMTCPTGTATLMERDASEWCRLLQGASEQLNGNSVGTLLGGRGCVEETKTPGEYLITVAWQGLTPLTAPPDGVACGLGSYNGAGGCTEDRCRRVVTTVVRVAAL